MSLKQDIASASAYISRADRRIQKERGLIDRSHNPEMVSVARDLVDVLTTLRANVEHRRRRLQREAETPAAKKRH